MPKQRTRKPSEDLTVANTILAQLGGGGRLTAMIGATNFLGSANSLQFRFAAPATNGANSVRIVLDASDTYTVEFYKIGHAPKVEWTTRLARYSPVAGHTAAPTLPPARAVSHLVQKRRGIGC